MDPRKAAAQWLYQTTFQEEALQPRPVRPAQRLPAILRTARSLENGPYQSWQSRESVFMKQGKLLVDYEDDYDGSVEVARYYPTYQSLTDPQLRAYFSWRTKLRKGDVRPAPLSFAFLYIYELINQLGVENPMDGYQKLTAFRDAYGLIDDKILSYLSVWQADYVIYYGLDQKLLADAPQVVFDRCVDVLDHIQEREPAEIMDAVRSLSHRWLGRSKFYAEYREDMDAVAVRVLRRISAHYAARCKRTMVEQYFGCCNQNPVCLFDAAVFSNPLKRSNYKYAVSKQRVYRCKNGMWSVWGRAGLPGSAKQLNAVLKTIDSVMRQAYDYRPVKAGVDTKWILRLIHEEVQRLLAEKKAAEDSKITINYAQLTQIRRDASITQEKLIVDEEMDLPPEEPALPEPEEARPAFSLFDEPGGVGESPLSPPEYRLLQCLLYGGDMGWIQAEGHLLSVLADGINEKLYDTFLDTVLDDTPQLIDDYIDDLKEMVRP